MNTDKSKTKKASARQKVRKVNPLIQHPDGSPKWENPTTVMQRGDSYGIPYYRTIPAEKPTHNWHLDADGVEVAKGQGEGQLEHEESGCTDYLQHSWNSCPENPSKASLNWAMYNPEKANPRTIPAEKPTAADIDAALTRTHAKLEFARLERQELADVRQQRDHYKAHAAKLAEACTAALSQLTEDREEYLESDIAQLRQALEAWEGAQK